MPSGKNMLLIGGGLVFAYWFGAAQGVRGGYPIGAQEAGKANTKAPRSPQRPRTPSTPTKPRNARRAQATPRLMTF